MVGTPTQPIVAGYWAYALVRLRHPDYDQLQRILNEIEETITLHGSQRRLVGTVGTPTQPIAAGYWAYALVRLRHLGCDQLLHILNEIEETIALHVL